MGGLEVTREDDLAASLDTCCGIVLYDGKGLRGLAHAPVPSEMEHHYRSALQLPDGYIVTPEQAAKTLLEEMVGKYGADRTDLHAGIFGCRFDPIGNANALEAKETLHDLRIPVIHSYTRTFYGTMLNSTPEFIAIEPINGAAQNLPITRLPYI
tara:strand:+ start:1220 stop:1681 length:462 start_codon:yes stop_codon:yes gene_type:complete